MITGLMIEAFGFSGAYGTTVIGYLLAIDLDWHDALCAQCPRAITAVTALRFRPDQDRYFRGPAIRARGTGHTLGHHPAHSAHEPGLSRHRQPRAHLGHDRGGGCHTPHGLCDDVLGHWLVHRGA